MQQGVLLAGAVFDEVPDEVEALLAQARTDRATALAALFKALGGDFAMADRTR